MLLKMDLMHFILWGNDIFGHTCFNETPSACSIIMYAEPMGFVNSSHQSRTFGIGILALRCTDKRRSVSRSEFVNSVHDLTVSDHCDFGVRNIRSRTGNMGRKLCYNASSIIGRDNERSAKSTFDFLAGFN